MPAWAEKGALAMQELPFQAVRIADPFWSPRLEINAREAIFHQWEQLEKSGCIDNFRIAAGDSQGFREGWFFADSDAYKWLDAAARIHAAAPDPRLKARMDSLIDLIGRAQRADGYIFTYNQLHFGGMRWVDLQVEHELYCLGHLIEAGVSHHQATGEDRALAIARRAADLLVREFLDAGPDGTCGHEEIELALLRLHAAAPREEYLELARRFLERRGRIRFFPLKLWRQFRHANARKAEVRRQRAAYLEAHPEHRAFQLPPDNPARKPPLIVQRWYASALSGKYSQQHAPIRRQQAPVGHAVRWGYLETAVAMLHRVRPDPSLLPALEKAWERMVTRRMYVTGGLGALPALEGFGRDYELDPEYAYAETCAALASMFWNWEMALISADARYSDLFEWQLYNAAGAGMGLGGTSYLYNNPLASRGGLTRLGWYAVPCCPSNLSRTWAGLGRYIYSYDRDAVWVHQYIGSRAALPLPGGPTLSLESELPWRGQASLRLDMQESAELTVHLRAPSWSPGLSLRLNGNPLALPGSAAIAPGEAAAGGYDPRLGRFLSIRRAWQSGDVLELAFDLPIVARRAHARVKGHAGRVALTRGPLVYCLESLDNPGVDLCSVQLDLSSLQAAHDAELLGGTDLLQARSTGGQPLVFIPYPLWANRGSSQMSVWVRAR